MAEFARSHSFEFAYLYDESQEVARAYRATCTPDFFLFDEQHRLVYRGQFDGSRPGNSAPVDGADSGTCAAGEGDGTHREAGSAGCAWAQTATDATEAASTVCARALSASAGVDAWQHQPALETIWRLCTLRCALIHFQL